MIRWIYRGLAMKLPVIVTWKCSNCGTYNSSNANLMIQSDIRMKGSRKNADIIEKEIRKDLRENWKERALGIVQNPISHPEDLKNNLFLGECKCKECGQKEKWIFNKKLLLWLWVAFLALLIAVVSLFYEPTSYVAWIIAMLALVFVVAMIKYDESYKDKLLDIPKESMPEFICGNKLLQEYAQKKGIDLNTLEALENLGHSLGTTVVEEKKLPPMNETIV